MKNFEYAKPATLKDAVGLLGPSWNDTVVLAGGTDLVASMKDLIVSPARVVDLKAVKELTGLGERGGRVPHRRAHDDRRSGAEQGPVVEIPRALAGGR